MEPEIEDGCGIVSSSLRPPRSCVPCSTQADDWLSQLHRDVEVLEPRDDHKTSLLDLLDRTTLKGSREVLAALLGSKPISDPSELRARQRALRELEEKGLGSSEDGLRREENELKTLEPDVLWFFRQKEDDTLGLLTDSVYFASWPLSILNRRSPLALSGLHAYNAWSPWVSVLSPVVYLVIPYLVLRWNGVVQFGFLRYLWLMMKSTVSQALCLGQEGVNVATRVGSALRGLSALLSTGVFFYSVVNSFELSRTFERVGKTVAERIEGALRFLEIARERRERFGIDKLFSFGLSIDDDPRGDRMIKKKRSAYLGRGEQLVDAKRFDHVEAGTDLSASYAFDALASVLKSRKALGFCWADPSDADRPFVDLVGLRHPFLPKEKAVENDWKLGSRDSRDSRDSSDTSTGVNALLTGPNAGGKSTLMKAVLSTVLLAQTLTIAPCRSCTITPFATIASHLSAVDRAGSASTFESEMRRAQTVLSHLSDERKTLVVLDEIFNSTNPVEGIAAATAVARRLGRSATTLSIISTHYVHVGKLVGEAFSKYQMPIVSASYEEGDAKIDQNTTVSAQITYPYKLRKGVCRQLIALELMKKSGFDASVVDEALEVVRSFSLGKISK